MSAVKGKDAGSSKQEIERLVAWRNSFAPATAVDGGAAGHDTRWEEVKAVGLDACKRILQAVVSIKCAAGYNLDQAQAVCNEHLRFFVDTGSGFQDAGVSSFHVPDLPDCVIPEHPLSYIVQRALPERISRLTDRTPRVAKVRVVLSWHLIPSANPEDLPLFGNRVEAAVQMEVRPMANAGAILPPIRYVPADLAVIAGKADMLPEVQVAREADPEIPEHRRAYPAVQQLFLENSGNCTEAALNAKGVSLQQVLSVTAASKASTEFEELACIGLCTSTDSVGGTIHLKKRRGYGIDPGTSGKEFVAFWADCNNDGVFEEYLGSASVEVRDADSSGRPALSYSVSIPVPDCIRLLRSRGIFKSVRIRGVLSWAVPPSNTDPEALSTWGNRIEAQVRLSANTATADEQRSVDPEFLTWLAQLRPSPRLAGVAAGAGDSQAHSPELDVTAVERDAAAQTKGLHPRVKANSTAG